MQNFLPFLIVLACPLMMIFMMRGMMSGGGASTQQHGQVPSDQSLGMRRGDEGDAGLRIAALEHEVAALRSGRVRLEKTATGKEIRRL